MLKSGELSLLTTPDVLRQAFPERDFFEGVSSAVKVSVFVIPQSGEPRWIIVGDPRQALGVLRSWNPWNTASRLRWSAVKLAASTGVLARMPRVEHGAFQIRTSYWRHGLPRFSERLNAVVHVGTPSHTRKAIVFFIRDDGNVECAAKVPLVEGGAKAILNEAAMLNRMKDFENLPRLIFQDPERAIAAQSWLEGRPVSRGFSQAHLDLVSALVNAGRSARVSEFRSETEADLAQIDLPFNRSVLARGLELLEFDTPMQSVVEHRDFAPWNLKWVRSGVLGLLDWEWSVPDGLPWQDICRFFYLDDVHFDGPGRVWEAMASNELLLSYRRRFEIPPAALLPLTMRYLLHVLAMDWISGNERLASYTFRQIERLLEVPVSR
jgi:hypothetical protein